MSIIDRIDRITHLPSERLMAVQPAPRSVKIELSGRCNYRCKFCALTVRAAQPTQDMDFEMFKRITVEMRDAGVEEVGVFFIGESFMNPELLVDAITYLKREVRMPYVFLTSNASMASPKHVERCMAAGLDSLKWSVNVSDEHQFEDVIGVAPKMFDRARQNIQAAWAVRNYGGYATKLYASSIRYDGAQHEQMQRMLDEQILPFVDVHYWLPLYSMGSLTIEQEERLGYRPSAGNIGRYDNAVAPLPCWSLFTEGHVLSDGRLSGCCFDATGNWIMGDLNSESFMSAWNSDRFRDLRKQHLNKNVLGTVCENCALYSAAVQEPVVAEITRYKE